MKKIISLILLCAMVFALCACGDKNIQPRFVGYWENADGSAKLTLNADGTAVFEVHTLMKDADGDPIKDENGKFIPSEESGTYNLSWIAESNSSILIKWVGEPILPAKTEEDATVEETVAVEVTEAVEETEEAAEGEAATDNGGTTTKRIDPYTVGYASMTVQDGKMILSLYEGSSDDILLFQFNGELALEKKK